jgi:hypothetical protein
LWKNKVYFLKDYQTEGQRLVLYSIDLTTLEEKASLPMPLPNGRKSGYPLCADDDNVYVVARPYKKPSEYGIYVYPHDGSSPWILGIEDGMPSCQVQRAIPFQGKLYLAIGEWEQTKYFVKVDMKTKKIDILASSIGRDGKAPFYNLSPPPEYWSFLEDPARNRLLVLVQVKREGKDRKRSELWAMDAKTEEFTLLFEHWENIYSVRFLPDDKHIILFGGMANYLANLEEEEFKISNYMCQGKMDDLKIPGLIVPYHSAGIIGNHFLGTIQVSHREGSQHWGRVALDGTSGFEPLPLPKNVKSATFLNCQTTPDGNALLIYDKPKLILLRFEKPTTEDKEQ